SCGQRFTTIERVQLRDLVVIKADSRRVPFERDKLARSVRIALRKRPVDAERIERIVNGLVRRLEAMGETDIPSRDIGRLVMDTLREIDSVAYIRFASVHWDFRETKDFADILGTISASVSGDAGEDFPAAEPKGKD
ncbi:MAG: ATP cone domain-containing protein, partial [Komagataeibacter saccharivorans]